MTAVKHHGNRTLAQKRIQLDQPAGLVRQNERRQGIPGPRRVFRSAIFVDSRDQPVDRLGIGRKDLAARRGIGGKLLVQRPLHVAALLEGNLEPLGIGR